jgi:hypothetical protein
MPYVETEHGSQGDNIRLRWPEAVKGQAAVMVRSDLSF